MAILDSTIIKGDLKVLGKIKEHGNSGVNFSTAEQVYGTGIDGKTVYCKTFQYAGGIASGATPTIATIGAIGQLVKTDINVYYPTDGCGRNDGWTSATSHTKLGIILNASTGELKLSACNDNGASGATMNITICYTRP